MARMFIVAGCAAITACASTAAPSSITATPPPAACAPTTVADFPLYPGAQEDTGLRGTVRLGAKRFRVRVYRVAAAKRTVRAYYERCLRREPSRESEEGSDHFEGAGTTLTISGTNTETTLRIRHAD